MSPPAYHWDAAEYAQFSAAQYGWAQELVDKLDLQPGEAVLDIGCGDGRVTALLAERVGALSGGGQPSGYAAGVDLSAEMLGLARRRFPAQAYRRLGLCRMDAAALGFAGRFEAAFSNAALHWVPDHRAVLAGVSRSLKPDGRLLFQMGGRGNAAVILAVLDRVIERDAWRPYFQGFHFPYSFYSPEEYLPWLDEAGLEARRVELLEKDMRHAGREGLAGWIRTTWLPYTERVPEQIREGLISEVAQAYLAEDPADPQGIVHVKMVRLEVEAAKPAAKPAAKQGGKIGRLSRAVKP